MSVRVRGGNTMNAEQLCVGRDRQNPEYGRVASARALAFSSSCRLLCSACNVDRETAKFDTCQRAV